MPRLLRKAPELPAYSTLDLGTGISIEVLGGGSDRDRTGLAQISLMIGKLQGNFRCVGPSRLLRGENASRYNAPLAISLKN